MKLQSVRDLKLEVFESVVKPFAEEAAATMLKPLAVAAGSAEPRPHRSFALGVAQRGGEFKLAIRVQRQGLMHSKVVEKLIAKAKGEVDLRLVGRVDKRPTQMKAMPLAVQPWNRLDMRPMIIGSSIGHRAVTAGTLGVFVREAGKPQVYILSNNHVLANENDAKKGDIVLQRAHADGGRVGMQDMALLERFQVIDFNGRNTIDAAIAIAKAKKADINPSLLRGIDKGADRVLLGSAAVGIEDVFKLGRTTGATAGRVTAIEVDNVVVGYEAGDATFDGCLEIESTTNEPFSDGGDSGSLIVNREMNGIGLLFAGSDTGGSNGLGVTYANSLLTVLQDLGVQLVL